MKSTTILQFHDLFVLSSALSVVPATSADVNCFLDIFYLPVLYLVFFFACIRVIKTSRCSLSPRRYKDSSCFFRTPPIFSFHFPHGRLYMFLAILTGKEFLCIKVRKDGIFTLNISFKVGLSSSKNVCFNVSISVNVKAL